RADRLLARLLAAVHHVLARLHRERLVAALADERARAAVPRAQERAVLPAVRHGAQLPRGRAGLRGGPRPVALLPVPAGGPGWRRGPGAACVPGLDDDAVDGP